MCRNIKSLFNFDPPATEEEIKAASLQFVRKLTGFTKPSQANEKTFNLAVEKVTADVQNLLGSLITNAKPLSREIETKRARERTLSRFDTRKN